MEWLTKLFKPVNISVSSERKTLVRLNKINVHDLVVCQPKGIQREQSLWRQDRLDFYHLWSDGTIVHTPGDKP